MSLFVVLVDVAVGELLPAQLTLVRFILTVDDLVSRGLIQTLEAPAADVTGVRTLFRVCDHVSLQLIRGDELFIAVSTVKYLMNLAVFLQVE